MKTVIVILMLIFLFSLPIIDQAMAQEQSQNNERTEVIKEEPIKAGQFINQTKVLKQPSDKSLVLIIAKENEFINVHGRKRAWYNISTKQNIIGWVKMLNVRFSGVVKRQGELGIANLLSSATNNTLPTVSTGVRGFDDEDLKSAKANLKQVELLSTYAVSAESVHMFATQGNLHVSTLNVTNEETK